MAATDPTKEWLRVPCTHAWRLGPLTDRLMRHRAAVCIKCWEYAPVLREEVWGAGQFPVWTDDDYEQHKDEVERRFFATTPPSTSNEVKTYG